MGCLRGPLGGGRRSCCRCWKRPVVALQLKTGSVVNAWSKRSRWLAPLPQRQLPAQRGVGQQRRDKKR